jgi:hypothetical protein
MPPATEIARLQHSRSTRRDCPSGGDQPIRGVISGRDGIVSGQKCGKTLPPYRTNALSSGNSRDDPVSHEDPHADKST